MQLLTSNRRDRDIARWNCQHHEYADAASFLSRDSLAEGIHSIRSQAVTVDALYMPIESKVLHVFFHGALANNVFAGAVMPVFSGATIGNGINASRLMISDATLEYDRRLRIGWFSGGEDSDVPDLITTIVNHVTAVGGYENVVLLGGSAGGFAALRTVAHCPDAMAIVWNPQTDVGRYYNRAKKELAHYAFGEEKYNSLPKASLKRLTLLNAKSKIRLRNVIYLQNRVDHFHMTDHLEPFVRTFYPQAPAELDAVNRLSSRHLVLVGAWEGGHVAPPRKKTREILKATSKFALKESNISQLYAKITDIFTSPEFFSAQEEVVDKAV